MRLAPETRIQRARRLYKLHVRGWLRETGVVVGIVAAIVALDLLWRWLVRSESSWGIGLAASAGRAAIGFVCLAIGVYGMKVSVEGKRVRGAAKSMGAIVGGFVLLLKAFGYW